MSELKSFIEKIAKEAGKLSLDLLGKAKVSAKGPKDVVTEADFAVEKLIIGKIKERFPDHNIVAEESINNFDKTKPTWYIDPIDGTANYCKSDPNFAISIGFIDNTERAGCVYVPMHDELYYAETGKGAFLNGKKIDVSNTNNFSDALIQVGISPLKEKIDDSLAIFKYFTLKCFRARDLGFSAGQLSYVGCGRADAFVKFGQNPWDIAAGMVLIQEAGGKVTDIDGNDLALGESTKKHNIVASNGKFHDELLKLIKRDLLQFDRGKWW
ncbi:MAG: inositol monophosphatase family protein [archaeon]